MSGRKFVPDLITNILSAAPLPPVPAGVMAVPAHVPWHTSPLVTTNEPLPVAPPILASMVERPVQCVKPLTSRDSRPAWQLFQGSLHAREVACSQLM